MRIVAHGPGFAVEDQQSLTVLQAVIFFLTVHILKTVYASVVDYSLLVPKALGNWRVLVIDVLKHKLALLTSF